MSVVFPSTFGHNRKRARSWTTACQCPGRDGDACQYAAEISDKVNPGNFHLLKSCECGAGGSRAAAASLLARLHELAAAEEELAGHSAALRDAQARLQAVATAGKEHARCALLSSLPQTAGRALPCEPGASLGRSSRRGMLQTAYITCAVGQRTGCATAGMLA